MHKAEPYATKAVRMHKAEPYATGEGDRGVDWYFVGVDFGQASDFTVIAVVERAETTGAWDAVKFAWKKEVSLQLRYLERIPRGTPYPEVVERIAEVTQSGRLAEAIGGAPIIPSGHRARSSRIWRK